MAKDYRYEGNDAGEFCGISKGGPFSENPDRPLLHTEATFFRWGLLSSISIHLQGSTYGGTDRGVK